MDTLVHYIYYSIINILIILVCLGYNIHVYYIVNTLLHHRYMMLRHLQPMIYYVIKASRSLPPRVYLTTRVTHVGVYYRSLPFIHAANAAKLDTALLVVATSISGHYSIRYSIASVVLR